ncbi:unnamed protein product [Cunninghamella blakesleeana]
MLKEAISKVLESEQIKNQPLVTGITAATMIVGVTWFLNTLQNRYKDEIPLVPYVWPVIGSTKIYNKDQHKFAKETSEKYGPVYRAHLFGQVVTVVGDGHAEEVFTHPDMSFIESQRKLFDASHFFKDAPHNMPDLTLQNAIIKELNPRLKYYSPRGYMEFTSTFKELIGNDNEPISSEKIFQIVLQCICQSCVSIFVGPEYCNETNLKYTFMSMFKDISPEFSKSIWHQVLPWYHERYMKNKYPKWEDMKKHRSEIKKVVEKVLIRYNSKDKSINDTPESLLQYTLKLHPQENNDAALETLATMVEILFFVGVLTTVGTTIGVIMGLVKQKELLEELQKEQEQAIDNEIQEQKQLGTSKLTDNDVIDRDEFMIKNINHIYRRMAKLDSYLRESFRYGANTIGHSHTNISDHDVVLKSGAVIKPGEAVYINLYHVHQNNKNKLEEDLSEFKAFRHVGQQTPSTKVGENYLLFGMGKNACPGRWFAIHQMKGIITCMIRNYNITAQDDGNFQFEKRSM